MQVALSIITAWIYNWVVLLLQIYYSSVHCQNVSPIYFVKNNQSKLDKMPASSGYIKLACRFKANKTWAAKNITSCHYFTKK